MKKILVTSLLAICSLAKASAQPSVSGIYLTGADFAQHKLSFASPRSSHIRLHEVIYRPYITILDGDSTTRLPKKSVFGYADRSGTIYRFFRKDVYRMLNPGTYPPLYEQTYSPGGRGAQHVSAYFFSKDESTPVYPLTKAAISKAFTDNASFVDQVYDCFSGDDDLIRYDGYRHTYMLVQLYRKLQIAAH